MSRNIGRCDRSRVHDVTAEWCRSVAHAQPVDGDVMAFSADALARTCSPRGGVKAESASTESPRCRNDSSRHDRPIFGNRRRLSLPVPPSWTWPETGSVNPMTSRGEAVLTSHDLVITSRRRSVPPSWALAAQTGSGDRMTSEVTRGDAAMTSQ